MSHLPGFAATSSAEPKTSQSGLARHWLRAGAGLALALLGAPPLAGAAAPTATETSSAAVPTAQSEPVFRPFEGLKWEKTNPELGDKSQLASILHVNPTTKATELIISAPKNYHVGRHWHSSNETITVIRGTFVVGHDGSDKKVELTPGSYAYMPGRMIHDAWTKDDGAVFFITVDGPWDINWVK